MVPQIAHAAGESSPGSLSPDTYVVVLAVPDECALTHLVATLSAVGVQFKAIREPDLGGTLTAIGVVPGLRFDLRRHFAQIPLLKFTGGSSLVEHRGSSNRDSKVGGSIPPPRTFAPKAHMDEQQP